jgi:LmbE family N-acetylglucosaminyl deacetylase
MKALFVHAHFDDYEFTASGTFELWKRKLGASFRAGVLVCTDGQAGHQYRTREETGRIRLEEQLASAKTGGYEFELLRLPNGETPREACLQVTPELLAALWKAIRDFEPDYLFCPPLAGDLLAGIHNDHQTIAEAVRRVAYMINVPHAFTPEYPEENPGREMGGARREESTGETVSVPRSTEVPRTPRSPHPGVSAACRASNLEPRSRKVPVILNVYDGYMFGANAYDLAVDVEEAFERICEMTWCHQSQIKEWLPWVGRHQMAAPKDREEWDRTLRARFERKNRELGIASPHAFEVFRVTAWGDVPTLDQLAADFPAFDRASSNLERLDQRLKMWRQA